MNASTPTGTPPLIEEREVAIPVANVTLLGNLAIPAGARAIILFAHGSGSSRLSPRNRAVATVLNHAGLATLLFDLLTASEEVAEAETAHLRFDIPFLAERLIHATTWLMAQPGMQPHTVGYFGASTGAAAALVAAANLPRSIRAIVSRGGRPDLAGEALGRVRAPTLLIVGGNDPQVLALNQHALERLPATKALALVPGATHLFEEPGALDQVAALARDWFLRYLMPTS